MQRLADDMQRYRSLRSSTAAVMGTAYVAHAALTGGTLAMQWAPLPIRPAVARVAGAALVVGPLLAWFRPPKDGPAEARPPAGRTAAMVVIGGVAAVWGLASLLA